MVMPMCSDGVHDMFMNNPWNLTAYEEGCMEAFGVKPDPYWVETVYGGKDIVEHSNIIFRYSYIFLLFSNIGNLLLFSHPCLQQWSS